ncbi:MAG: phospholipase D-like domain-containing protein [Nitrospiraceae bacterium]|nr:phospholipase D-like domain-containing protein [Nitrospiraceae bacterium]
MPSDLPASPIRRFSSRRQRLDQSFLTERLKGAKAYDRIAGYFCGSLLEVAGEALESVDGPIRIVCNSGLRPQDVATARAAAAGLRQEWCSSKPEAIVECSGQGARARLSRLHQFLRTGKMQVKVLPDHHFGLIHGKAGVITLADGSRTAFLGSVNESRAGWTLNYELLWEDSSPEAAVWVQEEFDTLWSHYAAIPLSDFILADIERLSRREVIGSVAEWVKPQGAISEGAQPASVFVEAPVYREQVGLWEHQKYFVKLAFDAHLHNPGGSRFVLADQVGLGKTVQLAMAAELMALVGDRPVLVLAPKALLWQWQGELLELLAMPSAVWNGRQWVDERGIEYPALGPEGIKKCPRRVGIVATSRAIFRCDDAEYLKELDFECIIVDEAHNARRQNLGPGRDAEAADANNLLSYLYEMATRTKSMLLATATPVQLRPIEAWDLLDVLSRGSEAVLGGAWSLWRKADQALSLVMGDMSPPRDDLDMWQWVRTPMPPRSEHRDFDILRRSLDLSDEQVSAAGSDWDRLKPPDKARVKQMFPRFLAQHNPFIRHIVRRSRQYLEDTIDPATGEPYLKPIRVELFGERDEDAIRLPIYLKEAYELAEEFCRVLGARMQGSGFLRTLLLRRVGSSIVAGRRTAEQMLATWRNLEITTGPAGGEEEEESDFEARGMSQALTEEERLLLQRFVKALEANQERDPKYAVVVDCLRGLGWVERGCIIFSQYFDTVRWLGEQLVEEFAAEPIGLYAGSGRSGTWQEGRFKTRSREEIKSRVRRGEIRLLLGTDAASEGLNLQRLSTLINLDLPWNPTRLEQRKGRIQRIGQLSDTVYVYNMRYLGSVEDRVHRLLSSRLQDIYNLFGQLPDVLEDVWIDVALGEVERAKRIIDSVPQQHPFQVKYHHVEKVDWESCARVLDSAAKQERLVKGW